MYSTTSIFIIVLFAALCHASWSLAIKSHRESLTIMGMTSITEIIVFLPLVFFVPLPSAQIWFFILISVALHGLYRLVVVYSYQFGDLSFVYPIARGGSALLITLITFLLLIDEISIMGLLGIFTVCIGIFLISRSQKKFINKKAFILAVITSILIATYSLIDGIGVRKSENGLSYIFWMLLLNGVPVLIYILLKKKKVWPNISKDILFNGFSAGLLAILSYGLVVWSMQHLEIAYVSSIRESSIVIATFMGVFLLGEKAAAKRVISSMIVLLGVTILYFEI
ncbi:MAG: hypothetical protein CFH21_00293 [Alphaproteobacteria bacterium MarineAlpha5_Bin11]|nr:hypothetical protein [Pelagibacteraceae bacterium]PPR44582.1 MAG: hypothetical protein CFH21_00293 [Alphaproteobacteria bacterium MarineAlpha5_Bin11]PPR50878.1 MAG: hypothetical protein CFH20_00844 [Alphaproteobacteria bacterium MarineAlpha5_Bin10]|tara:strand:- start:11122 stop:11967 length:846 start_codon:yes stop_codon:yes gene_type:complete